MSDAMFAGDHGPQGDWATLKGRMLAPWELSYDEQAENLGPDRLNQEVNTNDWVKTGPIMSGPHDPMNLTRGGGTMAK
jgi:hypothetical protein